MKVRFAGKESWEEIVGSDPHEAASDFAFFMCSAHQSVQIEVLEEPGKVRRFVVDVYYLGADSASVDKEIAAP